MPIPGVEAISLHGRTAPTDQPRDNAAESTRRSVASLLRTLIQYRAADLATVAGVLRVPPRSLQRRLSEEGVTFRRLLSEVRSEIACQRLRHTDDPIADVARDLGYADAPHFVRAFRGWHGKSPGRWREAIRVGKRNPT